MYHDSSDTGAMSGIGTESRSTGVTTVVGSGQDRTGSRGGEYSGAGNGGGERGRREMEMTERRGEAK